jgi:hypothetical protein
MQRLKVIGLALVAVFAISAVTSATASAAEPEFKPKAGTFPVAFSASSLKTDKLVTANHTIECTGGNTTTGEVAGAREAKNVKVKFTKCKDVATKEECKNVAAETIETKVLKSKPVYIKGHLKPKEERGLDLEPEAAGAFAEFECGKLIKVKVKVQNKNAAENSVIGVIAAAEVGVQKNVIEVNFNQVGGVQAPQEYENETGLIKTKDFLESEIGGVKEVAGEEAAENKLTFAGGETVELT